MLKILKVALFTLVLFIPSLIYSQFSTFEIYGTKPAGLADISSVLTGIDASYTNIAGLQELTGSRINMHYQNRFGITELKVLGLAYGINIRKLGAFAFTLKEFGIEEYNEFEAGLGYARKLTSALSGGLQFNFFNLAIKGYGSRSSVSFNAGLQYTLNNNIMIGFSAINPFPVRFTSSASLPSIIAAGIRYNAGEKVVFYSEIEKHIDLEYAVKIALEYNITRAFCIYGGYINSPSTYAGYSFGFGYSGWKKMILEMSVKYNITLGLSPSIGFTYIFTPR